MELIGCLIREIRGIRGEMPCPFLDLRARRNPSNPFQPQIAQMITDEEPSSEPSSVFSVSSVLREVRHQLFNTEGAEDSEFRTEASPFPPVKSIGFPARAARKGQTPNPRFQIPRKTAKSQTPKARSYLRYLRHLRFRSDRFKPQIAQMTADPSQENHGLH